MDASERAAVGASYAVLIQARSLLDQCISNLLAMQVVFRLLTFVVNGVALRYISRDLLGIVNVR